MIVTGGGGWALLAELSLPFLALTALATSILWLRQRRSRMLKKAHLLASAPLGRTLNVESYASRAALGRRLASGPF